MNSNFLAKKELRAKTPVTVLIIFSLVLTAICNFIVNFVRYRGPGYPLKFDFGNYFNYDTLDYILHDTFEPFFNFLPYVISLIPIILFAIYIFKYNKQSRADILIPISFSIIALYPICNFISALWSVTGFNYFGSYTLRDTLSTMFPYVSFCFWYGSFVEWIAYTIALTIDLLIIVFFFLAARDTFKGFFNKKRLIIATACGIFKEIILIIIHISYGRIYLSYYLYYNDLYKISYLLLSIGFIFLYVALLLFFRNNDFATTIKKKEKALSPEQSLRILKEAFDNGTISEKEYQTQRAEIISKL